MMGPKQGGSQSPHRDRALALKLYQLMELGVLVFLISFFIEFKSSKQDPLKCNEVFL